MVILDYQLPLPKCPYRIYLYKEYKRRDLRRAGPQPIHVPAADLQVPSVKIVEKVFKNHIQRWAAVILQTSDVNLVDLIFLNIPAQLDFGIVLQGLATFTLVYLQTSDISNISIVRRYSILHTPILPPEAKKADELSFQQQQQRCKVL
jgi:hypothetical protein